MNIRADADRAEKISLLRKYPGDYLPEEENLDMFRQVAYDLYEKKGALPGTEFASWLEAAQIVKSMGPHGDNRRM